MLVRCSYLLVYSNGEKKKILPTEISSHPMNRGAVESVESDHAWEAYHISAFQLHLPPGVLSIFRKRGFVRFTKAADIGLVAKVKVTRVLNVAVRDVT